MTPGQARQIRAALAAVILGAALVLIGAAGHGTTAYASLILAAAVATARPSGDRP